MSISQYLGLSPGLFGMLGSTPDPNNAKHYFSSQSSLLQLSIALKLAVEVGTRGAPGKKDHVLVCRFGGLGPKSWVCNP